MQEHISKTFQNISTMENEKKHCFFTYLKIITLPTVVFLYVLLGYLGLIHFKVGQHSVILVGMVYIVSLLFARHNAEFGACYFKRYSKEFTIELNEYIRKNMMRIGEQIKSNASFDDFINQYSKRIRNDNYASVGAAIFPTMGILGTFLSIAITLPDFSSQTASALEQDISLLLSGVGTAFYVSIYGILLSLWWIFFEKRGLSRFDRDIEAIKEEMASSFWTKEEIEQAYLKENLQHFEKIGGMFERLSSNDFFERLGKSIEEKFGLFDEMLKLEAQAVKKGAEHLKEGMEALSRSQEKQRDLGNIHAGILALLENFTETTKALHVSISQEQKELLASNKELVESLQERVSPTETSRNDEEVVLLKESLRKIDAETEQIIQQMDALR